MRKSICLKHTHTHTHFVRDLFLEKRNAHARELTSNYDGFLLIRLRRRPQLGLVYRILVYDDDDKFTIPSARDDEKQKYCVSKLWDEFPLNAPI